MKGGHFTGVHLTVHLMDSSEGHVTITDGAT